MSISAPEHSRRTFLVQVIGTTLATMLPGCELSAMPSRKSASVAASFEPPRRSHGSTRINIRDSGARGDGVHDDTAAFQNAIDTLPDDGGIVEVPKGVYLIDAVRSVRLRSRMRLELAADAKLAAKPNDSAKGAYVLYLYRVEDVEIVGGRIVGERDDHRGTEGEWGHGIMIRGSSHVTVRDVHISRCWGDGICVGPAKMPGRQRIPNDDIVIAKVVSTGNRRQGMSIGESRNVRVYDSEFSDTHGTSPQCGIDIEPGRLGVATDVHIENCLVRRNASYGINVFKRSDGVTIKRCTIENNKSCGIVTVGSHNARIVANTIRNNGSTGLFIRKDSRNCYVSENTFYNNYAKRGSGVRSEFSLTGANAKVKRDILVSPETEDIEVATNRFL